MVKAAESPWGMGTAIITKAWIEDVDPKYNPLKCKPGTGGVVKAITHDPNVTLTLHYYLLEIMNFDTEIIIGMSLSEAKAYMWEIYHKHKQLTKLIESEVPRETSN